MERDAPALCGDFLLAPAKKHCIINIQAVNHSIPPLSMPLIDGASVHVEETQTSSYRVLRVFAEAISSTCRDNARLIYTVHSAY